MSRWFLNFSFEGRARRRHAWANFLLWVAVLAGVVGGVVALAQVATAKGSPVLEIALAAAGLALAGALVCAVVDQMAISFRRAHDTGRTGWIWLLLLIPAINLLPLYWLLIEDSEQGPNKYGPAVKPFRLGQEG